MKRNIYKEIELTRDGNFHNQSDFKVELMLAQRKRSFSNLTLKLMTCTTRILWRKKFPELPTGKYKFV